MIKNYISNGPTLIDKTSRYKESQIFSGDAITNPISHRPITVEKLKLANPDLTII